MNEEQRKNKREKSAGWKQAEFLIVTFFIFHFSFASS
jgi:hypothetical protein